ncbi:MAG: sigma-54 dependent transcriptional regulator, partial [Candidatus Auribacterota bacterium]|nr:sigma-54 dependent transcriptional regulator [Candidatus Auribacterota bacterium]
AENGEEAYEIFKKQHPDLVLTDIRMPKMGGLSLLDKIKLENKKIPVILITAYGTIDSAVDSMKRGAADYITKPVNLDKLEAVIKKALTRKKTSSKTDLESSIIGTSPLMKNLYNQITKVALSNATILITGESGTGKEVLAQDIHKLSKRPGKLIPVHCSALPETLLESELFGYEKGAFTGAASRKLGRFDMAAKGTLFLDEISEISPSIQIKLLRVLHDKTFEMVGGTETHKADIRIIAATNKNLEPLIKSGQFREDLYYRLNVIHFHLPPLRQRRADISLFVNRFIEELGKSSGKLIESISEDSLQILVNYSWPGNIRQLKNVIERMILLTSSRILDVKDIPQEITAVESAFSKPGTTIKNAEKDLIIKELENTGGNKTETAKRLGISRKTLYRKMEEFGL